MLSETWLDFNIKFSSYLMILALYFPKGNTAVTANYVVHYHIRLNIGKSNEIEFSRRYRTSQALKCIMNSNFM